MRKIQHNEQIDFLIKSFMRIVFKAIYIQNQEIVSFELNEPWQTFYDEGLKMDSRFRGNDSVVSGNDSDECGNDKADNGNDREYTRCKNQSKIMTITSPLTENQPAKCACYWKPTAGRWPQYRRTMEEVVEVVAGLEWYK